MDMNKIKLIYPQEFKKAVRDAFPNSNVLAAALNKNRYSVGNHLEREIEKLKTTSDEIVSSIELGIPSRDLILERESQRKIVEGLYFRWISIIEESADEYEEGEGERVSAKSSSQ